MTLMGVGTALGGGTITAGSAGTASPLGLFLVVEGTGQAGIGLSYMLAGLLVDPEHYSEEEIKNLPGSPSNALAKGVDEAAGNENHEIETTVSVITSIVSVPQEISSLSDAFQLLVSFKQLDEAIESIKDMSELRKQNTITIYDAKTSEKSPEEVIKELMKGMLWIPEETQ